MTPHGDTATQGSLPFLARVLFVAAVVLAFIVLGTTSAHAVDLDQPVEDTADAVDKVAEPIEETTGAVTKADDPSKEADSEPDEKVGAAGSDTPTEPVEDVVASTTEIVTKPVKEVVEKTAETAAKPVEDVVASTTEIVTKPVKEVVEKTAETAAKPVEEVVARTAEAVIKPIEEPDDDVTKPVGQVVRHATGAVAATVEPVIGETAAQVERIVSSGVDTTREVVTETTGMVGSLEDTTETVDQLAETASSVLQTTTGELTETVDEAVDDAVTSVPEDTVTGTFAPTVEAPAGPVGAPSRSGEPIAPSPEHRLVPDSSWTPGGSVDPPSSQGSAGAHPTMKPRPPHEVTVSMPVALGSILPDAPAPGFTPSSGIGTAIAITGSPPPGAGSLIVFLAAALLLMGHIAPRLTEWLRLRPLIWRDDGLALAIERPG